jgi:hypothetical protein
MGECRFGDGNDRQEVIDFVISLHAYWSNYTSSFLTTPVDVNTPEDATDPSRLKWLEANPPGAHKGKELLAFCCHSGLLNGACCDLSSSHNVDWQEESKAQTFRTIKSAWSCYVQLATQRQIHASMVEFAQQMPTAIVYKARKEGHCVKSQQAAMASAMLISTHQGSIMMAAIVARILASVLCSMNVEWARFLHL